MVSNRLTALHERMAVLDERMVALGERGAAIDGRLATLDGRMTAVETRIATPEEREATSRATALSAAGWVARSPALRRMDKAPRGRPRRRGPDLAAALAEMAALEPTIFPIWQRLHEADTASYIEAIEASCSHWDQKYARLFGAFVSLFARGHLLDVGCGINGRPSYLAGYPAELITGLDPRPSRVAVDFEYAQGFNEFLPWEDGAFDTVVSGTSLDHVLSLERALDEVRRVLVPGGLYLVWLASIPGAKPYEPHAEGFAPVDQFHLFHFDRKWVEPLFEQRFSMEEVCVISQPGFDHVFYSLAKKRV